MIPSEVISHILQQADTIRMLSWSTMSTFHSPAFFIGRMTSLMISSKTHQTQDKHANSMKMNLKNDLIPQQNLLPIQLPQTPAKKKKSLKSRNKIIIIKLKKKTDAVFLTSSSAIKPQK